MAEQQIKLGDLKVVAYNINATVLNLVSIVEQQAQTIANLESRLAAFNKPTTPEA